MSKTDKTDPAWLQEYLYGRVKHDHRSGVCLEETFEAARPSSGPWRAGRHHWRNCPKREVIAIDCPCDNTCWHWVRAQAQQILVRGPWGWERRPVNCPPHRHERVVVHTDVPCVFCDNKLAVPTCTRDIPMGYIAKVRRLYGDGPDREFRNKWEAAARRAARDTLRCAARDYNTNGDTDVEPEPVRHRHAAHWAWW